MRSVALIISFLAMLPSVRASASTDLATKLYFEGRFDEAEAALRKIAAAEPRNAIACHFLGLVIQRHGDNHSFEESLAWLEKAVDLDPSDKFCLADYGGTCLQIAAKRRSIIYAVRGRNALEKAIAIDPSELDFHDGLMRFFATAPWPLGGLSKALGEAEQISGYNRSRGLQAYLDLEVIFEKANHLSAAQVACNAALTLDPANRAARTALVRLSARR